LSDNQQDYQHQTAQHKHNLATCWLLWLSRARAADSRALIVIIIVCDVELLRPTRHRSLGEVIVMGSGSPILAITPQIVARSDLRASS
jgi:hypothetical protein